MANKQDIMAITLEKLEKELGREPIIPDRIAVLVEIIKALS